MLNQVKTKLDGVINAQNYNFRLFREYAPLSRLLQRASGYRVPILVLNSKGIHEDHILKENTRNSINVKFGKKVVKLMED